MSHRHSNSQSMSLSSGPAPKVKQRNPNGTKRCLQLDLRGVRDGQAAYHLGTLHPLPQFSTSKGWS
jgi:hypothetical protein